MASASPGHLAETANGITFVLVEDERGQVNLPARRDGGVNILVADVEALR